MFKEKNTYNPLKEYLDKKMETTMGLMYSFTWNNDPKHVGFTISRYKFVSKMLEGKKNVLAIYPGFSSDCVETLEEILIQGKESFLNSGGENFDVVPCLNYSDDHIVLLKSLIQKSI